MSAGKSYFLNTLFKMFAPAPHDYQQASSAEREVVGLVPGGTRDEHCCWVPLEGSTLAACLCAADAKNRANNDYQFLCPEGMHWRVLARGYACRFRPNVHAQATLRTARLLARSALFTAEDTSLRDDMNGQKMSLAAGKLLESYIKA
jgi:hypothetical protein